MSQDAEHGCYKPMEPTTDHRSWVTILTQSHLFPTVITPPLQGDLFLNFDREMAVQINCNSNNVLYLQCFYL